MTRPGIQFEGVSSDVYVNRVRRPHLRDVTLDLPARRIALLAPERRDGEGVIDILCRKTMPLAGRVRFRGTVSWPIGRMQSFTGAIKGTDVVSFLCSVYGVNRRLALDFLGEEFDEPDLLPTRLDRWPPALRTRFAMLTALLPQFDCYLVEGSLVQQDHPAFSMRYLELLAERVRDRLLVVSTRQAKLRAALCDCAIVVADGSMTFYDDLSAGLRHFEARAKPESDAAEVYEEPPKDVADDLLI